VNKRNDERREGKAAGRKRNAARDLVAGKDRKVVGGLLPAVKPARQVEPRGLFDQATQECEL